MKYGRKSLGHDLDDAPFSGDHPIRIGSANLLDLDKNTNFDRIDLLSNICSNIFRLNTQNMEIILMRVQK